MNIGLISQKEGFGGRSMVYTAYEFEVEASKKKLVEWRNKYIG